MPTDRRDLRRKLFHLAAEQGGYFTAAQAREIGYSYQAQAYHAATGDWLRIERGMFRLREWIPNIHDDLARWTLWSRGRAVVSHETALSVHSIGEFESPRVQLTVPAGFRMRDEGVTLHYGDLPGGDVMARTGFRLTTPTRTIIDVAAFAPDEDQLARAIDDALRNGLITIRALRTRAEAVDPRAALFIERAIQRTET